MLDLQPYWQNYFGSARVDGVASQAFVNAWNAGGVETPFGGYGKSGYGRDKGRETLWNDVQTKNIAIRLGGAA